MNLRIKNVSNDGIVNWLGSLINQCNVKDDKSYIWNGTHLAIWTCWGIYHQRNSTVFRREAVNPTTIIHLIETMMMQHESSSDLIPQYQRNGKKPITPIPLDELNWIVDFCTWKRNRVGIGIFRNINNFQSYYYGEVHDLTQGINCAVLLTIQSFLERLATFNQGLNNISITRKSCAILIPSPPSTHLQTRVIHEDICNLYLF